MQKILAYKPQILKKQLSQRREVYKSTQSKQEEKAQPKHCVWQIQKLFSGILEHRNYTYWDIPKHSRKPIETTHPRSPLNQYL